MNYEDSTPHGNAGQKSPQETSTDHTNAANFAIVSLIIGIISLLFMCLPPVQMVLSVLAIMFAFLSRRNRSFTGYAKAGLIIGFFSCITSLYIWALVVSNLSAPEFTAMYNELYQNLEQMYGSGVQK